VKKNDSGPLFLTELNALGDGKLKRLFKKPRLADSGCLVTALTQHSWQQKKE
jgi:hypothetical protein